MTTAEAILKTLTYHDIFDYPLTLEEIYKYLIGKKASIKSVRHELKNTIYFAIQHEPERSSYALYALRGRQKLFQFRKFRQKISHGKLLRAKIYSKLLSTIPTIKLIAVSGALAMQNSHKNDDIDLVIISAKNTLWTTRFLANLILWPFRRLPNSKLISDRACLNIFIDESNLKISPQNLYIAHEICQMKPLFDKDKTYSRLFKANRWIFKYLPNWQSEKIESRRDTNWPLISDNWKLFENLLKNFQLWYMRKRISTERVGETQLFFHPRDTQERILKEYQKRLELLKIY